MKVTIRSKRTGKVTVLSPVASLLLVLVGLAVFAFGLWIDWKVQGGL